MSIFIFICVFKQHGFPHMFFSARSEPITTTTMVRPQPNGRWFLDAIVVASTSALTPARYH